MNLFELFIKIGVDDQASSKLSALSGKLGNGLKTAAKIGTAAVGTATAGIAALTTAAVNSFAEYEQLAGGAQKIFDQMDYSKIAADANNAYKELGLSANQYLSVVNDVGATFAATMGDEAGYEAAKTGLKAISDYASGTGKNVNELSQKFTLITRSTSSYQSIADQFSGILPATSSGFLEQAQAAGLLSDKYKQLTEVPIAEYQDAVSKMLEKGVADLGLANNTMEEAFSTLSGSLAMAKSAWSNLVAGLADDTADLDMLIGNFVESVGAVATNLIPKIGTALNGVSKLVRDLIPVIVQEIPALIEENLPILADAAVGIIQSLIDGISQNQEMLFDTIVGVVMYLSESFITMLPQIVQLGLDLIVSLANGIAESLPELIPTIVDVVLQIVDTLVNNVDKLAMAAVAINLALAMGLIESIPKLIEAIPKIVVAIVNCFMSLTPQITEVGKNIVNDIGTGIKSFIFKANTWATELILNFLDGIKYAVSKTVEAGKSIVNAVGDGIKSLASEAITWGKDMIDNFVSGIKSKISAVTSAVSRIASTVKSFLGFSEPEKGPLSNFHTYAPDMMDLFIKGIRDNEKKLTDQIEKTFDFGERTITAGISYRNYGDGGFSNGGGYGAGHVSVVQNIYSEAKTAADLMQEALYQQEKAVLLGV